MSSSTSSPGLRTTVLVIVLVAFALVLLGPLFWLFPRPVALRDWTLFAPLGLLSVLNLALAIWVGVDAERRCGQGLLWGLLVFFTSIVGLVVYLLVCTGGRSFRAPSETGRSSCVRCRAAIEPGFKICPYCGERLERGCPSCSRPVREEWRLCPHCGTNLRGEKTV